MSKRFYLLFAIFFLIILPSCRLMEPTSPVITGDVGDVANLTPIITPSNPSPSKTVFPTQSPHPSAEHSPSEDEIEVITRAFVRTGTYLDPIILEEDDDCVAATFTEWSDAYYWPTATAAFYNNGYIMGELNEFAASFNYSVEILNSEEYSLKSSDGNELILAKNFDVAIINGIMINIEAPTICRLSTTIEGGYLFVPLHCVAELMGLYTYEFYDFNYNTQYLWLSESSILDEEEFNPDDSFVLTRSITEAGYTGGYVTYDEYKLLGDGCTYSGVSIGDSYDKVISFLGAPQIYKTYDLDATLGTTEQPIYFSRNLRDTAQTSFTPPK